MAAVLKVVAVALRLATVTSKREVFQGAGLKHGPLTSFLDTESKAEGEPVNVPDLQTLLQRTADHSDGDVHNVLRPGTYKAKEVANDIALLQVFENMGLKVEFPTLHATVVEPLWDDSKNQPITSCEEHPVDAKVEHDPAEFHLGHAVRRFCDAGLDDMVDFYVDPQFVGNHRHFTDAAGWFPEAFVTYIGLRTENDTIGYEADLLLQSVHHFSRRPIVVANFGNRVPKEWVPERFPRMVLVHARPLVPHKRFNLNKLRLKMFTKVRVGVSLDADQWINQGLDHMFQRAAHEGKNYPFPIMPVHWMSRDPRGGDYQSYQFHFKSDSAPERTMRWGHSHSTWTHEALDFLGKWTSRMLSPETTDSPEWLKAEGSISDEPTLNVGLWADGARKQWCKFDITSPNDFRIYMKQSLVKGMHADEYWFPRGVPMVFFTAHDAKNPGDSYKWLTELWKDGAKTEHPKKRILYDGRWFDDGEALKQYDPNLKCTI